MSESGAPEKGRVCGVECVLQLCPHVSERGRGSETEGGRETGARRQRGGGAGSSQFARLQTRGPALHGWSPPAAGPSGPTLPICPSWQGEEGGPGQAGLRRGHVLWGRGLRWRGEGGPSSGHTAEGPRAPQWTGWGPIIRVSQGRTPHSL